jgi:hypothetical protein
MYMNWAAINSIRINVREIFIDDLNGIFKLEFFL